jgi:hypothetical protein
MFKELNKIKESNMMKLKIIDIENHGKAKDEYVRLVVINDCNLRQYLISDSTYQENGALSNKHPHYFWFPNRIVKKGELVILHTNTEKKALPTKENGNKVHRFYWGLGSAVWNEDGDIAYLFEIKDKQEKHTD